MQRDSDMMHVTQVVARCEEIVAQSAQVAAHVTQAAARCEEDVAQPAQVVARREATMARAGRAPPGCCEKVMLRAW
ncbi:hypothetical protein F8S13_20540 [Chloroflexia bacterium SDU3-3]|nr:hypothetical protein F8S13_20540 [Chloroflexia bacterium SDU3-3]